MDRRRFLWAGSCLVAATTVLAEAEPMAFPSGSKLKAALGMVEKASGGRLGVSVLDTASGARFAYRGEERFAMCSTFKLLLAAAILQRVDRGIENLDRRLPVRKEDLLGNSPFCDTRAGRDASVGELCEATVTVSDNAAANILLDTMSGPAALTAFFRSIGDPVSRLDRNEPSMSEAIPGDPRDTSTPNAMVETMRHILLGTVLKTQSLAILMRWLKAVKTGAKRLRAGLPADWILADKTGTGMHGTTNDVAIVWPPGRAPLIIVSYLTESPLGEVERQAILAEVGKAIGATV